MTIEEQLIIKELYFTPTSELSHLFEQQALARKLLKSIKANGAKYEIVKIKQKPDGSLEVVEDAADWPPSGKHKVPFREECEGESHD